MLLIGERINGMFKDIREAILNQNPEPVRHWANYQYKAGADYLDLSPGPAVEIEDQPRIMTWLVKTVQKDVPLPCCLDSTNPAAIQAGLLAHQGKAIINSTSASSGKMDILFPLALEYKAAIIGLTMNEKGVPQNAADRLALAMELVVNADQYGLPMEDLYLDPVVLPCNVAQEQGKEVLETMRQIKILATPSPHIVIGLSNVSQNCPNRNLLNRTFLIMGLEAGLDAAIVDLTDENLLDAVAAARILLNQDIYCDSFLSVFKKRR
ncbi:methyltetrahydrofolate:corrinoid methyltransferase [Peptococcaceae bacterium SCADC1_2_3]|jgi:5-methyltetrahydrofolate corrinoid/iron sulfur protein methyltransferase|nr:methyltetrahydrofolate:corrinoid methyltransferase [Peptococcaceae bacterium SCADC1_2_3]HCJ79059.1 methyltetrahydrofolate cobalamin methyltransferase [Desulfotomaculum sp.]